MSNFPMTQEMFYVALDDFYSGSQQKDLEDIIAFPKTVFSILKVNQVPSIPTKDCRKKLYDIILPTLCKIIVYRHRIPCTVKF